MKKRLPKLLLSLVLMGSIPAYANELFDCSKLKHMSSSDLNVVSAFAVAAGKYTATAEIVANSASAKKTDENAQLEREDRELKFHRMVLACLREAYDARLAELQNDLDRREKEIKRLSDEISKLWSQ